MTLDTRATRILEGGECGQRRIRPALVGVGRDSRGGRFVVAAHGDKIVGHAMRVESRVPADASAVQRTHLEERRSA